MSEAPSVPTEPRLQARPSSGRRPSRRGQQQRRGQGGTGRRRQSLLEGIRRSSNLALADAERLTKITGDGNHWAKAVVFSDALDELMASEERIHRAALEAGMTEDQWLRLRTGRSDQTVR